MHLSASYPNLVAIANKISSVISRIMIAEKITAFITTRKPAFSSRVDGCVAQEKVYWPDILNVFIWRLSHSGRISH